MPQQILNTVLRTPRKLCSFTLTKPQGGSFEGIVTHQYDSTHSSLSLEAAFVRQNLMKNRKLSSFMSMPSNNSGRSLATATSSTNKSNSTESNSIKRSNSISSVTSSSSLTSLQQQSRTTSKASSQRLPNVSLALSTNPQMATKMKIAFQQFLVVPTSDGSVLFYQVTDFTHAEACMQEYELNQNLFTRNDSYHENIANQRKMASKIQQEKDSVQPMFSLGPFHAGDYFNKSLRNITDKFQSIPASIVDVCICEVDETNQSPFLGTIVILTQEGDVHVLDLYTLQNQNSSAGVEDGPGVKVNHIHSFYSGAIGATSLAAQRALKETTIEVENTKLRHHQPELRISIGFEGGTVVEYAIVESRSVFKWRGQLDSTVQSLAYVSVPEKYVDTRNGDGQYPIGPPLDENLFLVIGTAHNGVDVKQSSATKDILSSCLDVIHVSGAENEWNLKFRDNSRKSSASVELAELSIWPSNNMRGDDSVMISLVGQKRRQGHEFPGLNAVLSLGVYSSLEPEKDHDVFNA